MSLLWRISGVLVQLLSSYACVKALVWLIGYSVTQSGWSVSQLLGKLLGQSGVR